MKFEHLRKMPLDELLGGAHGQPGSEMAEAIKLELERRREIDRIELMRLHEQVAKEQILASKAIVGNSIWIRRSAIAVILGTALAAVSIAVSLFGE